MQEKSCTPTMRTQQEPPEGQSGVTKVLSYDR